MKKKRYKIIIAFIISFIYICNVKIYAASMKMSINKSSAYVGETFTVTVSGINGKVNITSNSNVNLNISGSQWVDGSLTITGTAKGVGTGTITVTPVDASTTAAEPEEVTQAASRSITIKEKEPESTTPTNPTPTTPQTTTTPKKTNTNTNKTTTTSKTEEPKEEKQDDFYINKVVLTGVKESGEKVDISLSPEFQKDIYEYTCHVGAEIQKLELEKEAGDYTNSIIVTGLDDLKEGENSITLQLAAEDHEAKTYTIKVIKETQETIETIVPIDENVAKTGIAEIKTISMPLWVFIVMQILIIMIEVLAIYFIPWRNLLKKKIDIE